MFALNSLPLLWVGRKVHSGFSVTSCKKNPNKLFGQPNTSNTNKASGGDGIPVELFQILKDDRVKVLHSICQQIWKTQQWPQDWKRSVFIPISKKGNAKECSNNHTIALISHASEVMLTILQARFQQYMNQEHPDIQAGFRKGRGTRDQIPKSVGSSKKQDNSREISISALLTMPKPLTVSQ